MKNTAELRAGAGTGIIILLAIAAAAFVFGRRGQPVSAAVTKQASAAKTQATRIMQETLEGKAGVFATPEMQAQYEAKARLAVSALDRPDLPAGFLAAAVAAEETARGMPLEPASIGEQIYSTATGGVSIVRPSVADKILEMGGEAVYHKTQSGEYVNLYKNGQLVAKVTPQVSPSYVAMIGAEQATPPEPGSPELEITEAVAKSIADAKASQTGVPEMPMYAQPAPPPAPAPAPAPTAEVAAAVAKSIAAAKLPYAQEYGARLMLSGIA